MQELEMKELFERFKKEVLTNVNSEAEKQAIANSFIMSFSKI